MKTILIVEDESRTVDMLRLILGKAGYHVITAANGQEGLEQAKSERPDLILSDVLMPLMDGFAFYKELKKDSRTGQIPVIILSARGHMRDSFLALGVGEFLEKPSESALLLEKIEQQLKRYEKPLKHVAAKVMIAGEYPEVVAKINGHLKSIGCRTEVLAMGSEIIAKAILNPPDVLIIEVHMQGISAPEIIRAFRVLSPLNHVIIITYSFYHVTDLDDEQVQDKVKQIDSYQELCLEAGANEYIGRFNEQVFKLVVEKYI